MKTQPRECDRCEGCGQIANDEAEQRLRDAAPELLRALQNLLAVENKSWPTYVRQEFAAARAAVKKARGR